MTDSFSISFPKREVGLCFVILDLDAIPLSCPERRHFEKKPNTDFEPNSGEKKEDAGYTLHLGMGPMTKADSL